MFQINKCSVFILCHFLLFHYFDLIVSEQGACFCFYESDNNCIEFIYLYYYEYVFPSARAIQRRNKKWKQILRRCVSICNAFGAAENAMHTNGQLCSHFILSSQIKFAEKSMRVVHVIPLEYNLHFISCSSTSVM